MTRSSLRRRTIFLLLLLVAGCSRWVAYDPVVDPAVPVPEHLRVTLTSGEEITLRSARVEADSALVGRVDEGVTRVPARDVAALEERRTDWVGTGLLVALAAVAGLATLAGTSFSAF